MKLKMLLAASLFAVSIDVCGGGSSVFDYLRTPVAQQPLLNAAHTYPDGSVYTGEWLRSVPHGDGRLKLHSGEIYLGRFWHGVPKGIGMFEDLAGNVYRGEWKDGRRYGSGIMEYANGSVYEGSWVDDKREGRGRLRFPGGARYEGGWHDDMKHGQGELRTPNGERYTGDYANNVRHGIGTLVDSTGFVYTGTFSRDKRHGVGQCTEPGDKSETCVFNRGYRVTDHEVIARARGSKKDYTPPFAFDGGLAYLWEDLTTHQQGITKEPSIKFWAKASMVSTHLRIESNGGRSFFSMDIDDYKGPGRYVLGRNTWVLSFDGESALSPASGHHAAVTIIRDDGDVLDAEFSAPMLHVNGDGKERAYSIKRGQLSAKRGR